MGAARPKIRIPGRRCHLCIASSPSFPPEVPSLPPTSLSVRQRCARSVSGPMSRSQIGVVGTEPMRAMRNARSTASAAACAERAACGFCGAAGSTRSNRSRTSTTPAGCAAHTCGGIRTSSNACWSTRARLISACSCGSCAAAVRHAASKGRAAAACFVHIALFLSSSRWQGARS